MKILILPFILLALVPAIALAKTFYADVQVTELSPSGDSIWQRVNQNTPKYPIELARSGIRGCAILSFTISDSGKTEGIEIVKSVPKWQLGKHSRKMLKKWMWDPVSSSVEKVAENKTLRLDFCMGGESIEQAQKACIQQTKIACA
ncbi:energy transducer TonB [Colwellia sp. D2M02]|uniref:energy transducer TonB n=1 Tax=Colwellia sp. D2M02 TaxID=2841562 RepID=UPI001C086E7F|nr:energy transducer TonB [Colwellia sp. D2M02]MBU2893158.1 energy transducer TonB [Colwellia sp. D2M02]